MRKERLTLILLFSLVLGFSSCSRKENEYEICKVNYGTSFNECIGYCKKEIALKFNSASFTKSGWVENIETITSSEALDGEKWNFFRSRINIDAFMNLPETIGCPDCADGGAEWVEVELTNGKKYQVKFEYKKEPSFLKDYVNELRAMMESLEDHLNNSNVIHISYSSSCKVPLKHQFKI